MELQVFVVLQASRVFKVSSEQPARPEALDLLVSKELWATVVLLVKQVLLVSLE